MNEGLPTSSLAIGVDPLDAPPLRFKVAERIERMIVEGKLTPGTRLRENELAALLQVSRGPIREALQLLENDGWVEVRPRLGARVRERTMREVWEYFQIRSILEIHAAKEAAASMSDLGKSELKRLLKVCQDDHDANDLPALYESNRALHRYITELGGNQALMSLVTQLGRRVYAFTKRTPRRSVEVFNEHKAIVDAMLRKDVDAVESLMREHLHNNWLSYERELSDKALEKTA